MPARKPRPTPTVGAVFEKTFHGTVHKMVVVKTEQGVGYRVEGKVYPSVTAAAKAVTGRGYEVNGPRFWGLDRTKS